MAAKPFCPKAAGQPAKMALSGSEIIYLAGSAVSAGVSVDDAG
jgi:hypothetical protein